MATKKASSTSGSKARAKKAAPAKKTAAKKPAPAKKTGKKPAAKNTAAKNTATAKKATKKPAAKNTAAKKTATAKKAAKKTTAPTKKPAAKKKSPFDKKFLDAQRALLLAERANYTHSAEIYKQEADSLVADREPGDVQFDEESGEGDTLAVERARDLALSAQARAAVEQIDDALARIDEGTYGICVMSGQSIPRERLRAIPWATERVEFKAGGIGRR